jgi:hypothetical protein
MRRRGIWPRADILPRNTSRVAPSCRRDVPGDASAAAGQAEQPDAAVENSPWDGVQVDVVVHGQGELFGVIEQIGVGRWRVPNPAARANTSAHRSHKNRSHTISAAGSLLHLRLRHPVSLQPLVRISDKVAAIVRHNPGEPFSDLRNHDVRLNSLDDSHID